MKEIYNVAIILSFVGLWITSIIPKNLVEFFGFILIFSFGILHGSNDILLIKIIINKQANYTFFKVLTIYLLTVFVAIAIFYFIPVLALSLFIVFSAFHFGEQHWENKVVHKNQLIYKAYYFTYGLFVLMLLFIFNKHEVVDVVQSITEYQLNTRIIDYTFTITSVVLLMLSIYELYISKTFKSIVLIEVFYLIVFAIIFKVSTLIWGFTIYFILWHSVPSLVQQITFIFGSFNKKNVTIYVKRALPYWALSIFGLFVVFLIFKEEKLLYAIVFSFIAAVTFPHSLVINKMFEHKKTQSSK